MSYQESPLDKPSKYQVGFGPSELHNSDEDQLMIDATSDTSMDQVSTARPSVNMLDKLWTQIDVLDDVRTMAQEVQEKGSFLGEDFTQKLQAMKNAQLRLLETMKKQEQISEESRQAQARMRGQHVGGQLEKEDIARDLELKQKKMQDFFFGHDNVGSDSKQRMKEFEKLNAHVAEVRSRLDEVAASMAEFEDTTKDLW